MEKTSAPGAALMAAYRATRYRASLEDHVVELQIDKICWPLALHFKSNRFRSAAFVTACNPLSLALDSDTNALRQAQLSELLRRTAYGFVEGEGVDGSGAWLAEASFLVFNISEDRCEKLMRRFQQWAYVFVGRDCIPRLRLTCLEPRVFKVEGRKLFDPDVPVPADANEWGADDSDEADTPTSVALRYFNNLDVDLVQELGIEIIEGEHPGSSYYAAELAGSITKANAAARKHGLDIRFERASARRAAPFKRSLLTTRLLADIVDSQ